MTSSAKPAATMRITSELPSVFCAGSCCAHTPFVWRSSVTARAVIAVRRKGIVHPKAAIVRATALLRPNYPRLRCVLVGDCGVADRHYGQLLEDIAKELHIEEAIVFTGFQRNSIDYMNLMDVVAHTSIHPEPFGIVTLEAMSLAKPLVSTTIGGPAVVVIFVETGLLVDPGKPQLLADALDTYLADRNKAAEAGRRGYERLHRHFGIQKNLDQTLEVYRSILGPAASSPALRSAPSRAPGREQSRSRPTAGPCSTCSPNIPMYSPLRREVL